MDIQQQNLSWKELMVIRILWGLTAFSGNGPTLLDTQIAKN